MTGRGARPAETRSMVAQSTVATVIAAGFLVFFSIPGQFERMQARFDSRPVWLLLVLGSLPVVSLAVALGSRATGPTRTFNAAFAAAALPGVGATLLRRFIEPDPSWLGGLRAAGIIAMVCVLFGSVVVFGRRYVELDRLLFTEATSVAFFATLVVTAGYAALERYAAELPRLSFAWVPVIGLGIWGICAVVFRRRMS